MKIYTKTGDAGDTSLIGGPRVRKNHQRIEAYGTVDELNSTIGAARAADAGTPYDLWLHEIQSDLFDIGAQLATPAADPRFPGVDVARIEALERAIDQMDDELPELKTFILPGGTLAAAHLHIARTVCRRAERLAVALLDGSVAMETTIRYLNRLSDFLFTCARAANARSGVADIPWLSERGRKGDR